MNKKYSRIYKDLVGNDAFRDIKVNIPFFVGSMTENDEAILSDIIKLRNKDTAKSFTIKELSDLCKEIQDSAFITVFLYQLFKYIATEEQLRFLLNFTDNCKSLNRSKIDTVVCGCIEREDLPRSIAVDVVKNLSLSLIGQMADKGKMSSVIADEIGKTFDIDDNDTISWKQCRYISEGVYKDMNKYLETARTLYDDVFEEAVNSALLANPHIKAEEKERLFEEGYDPKLITVLPDNCIPSFFRSCVDSLKEMDDETPVSEKMHIAKILETFVKYNPSMLTCTQIDLHDDIKDFIDIAIKDTDVFVPLKSTNTYSFAYILKSLIRECKDEDIQKLLISKVPSAYLGPTTLEKEMLKNKNLSKKNLEYLLDVVSVSPLRRKLNLIKYFSLNPDRVHNNIAKKFFNENKKDNVFVLSLMTAGSITKNKELFDEIGKFVKNGNHRNLQVAFDLKNQLSVFPSGQQAFIEFVSCLMKESGYKKSTTMLAPTDFNDNFNTPYLFGRKTFLNVSDEETKDVLRVMFKTLRDIEQKDGSTSTPLYNAVGNAIETINNECFEVAVKQDVFQPDADRRIIVDIDKLGALPPEEQVQICETLHEQSADVLPFIKEQMDEDIIKKAKDDDNLNVDIICNFLLRTFSIKDFYDKMDECMMWTKEIDKENIER